ncbi:MAG: CHASE2 domain-containing protein [Treponema sp.]|nr:CHASE2 domain-containing protein [Treponema sp.]
MSLWKNALLGLAASFLFSILSFLPFFSAMEDRLYDFFLRFRINRPLIDSVVFLNVDDNAIAYNGVFPWPRSIPADGLLRLKEHGARAAIFDIEYIDWGPQGVDSLYLNQGLPADFYRSFTDIVQATQDVFYALSSGRMSREDIDYYSGELSGIIIDEHDSLYAKAQSVARDNDLYLAQALALFGNSWLTLNLRDELLEGEQAQRRSMAESRFSYPVISSDNAHPGSETIDILPPLPLFSTAAHGAGFTNVEIDDDGIRRRIYLTQNVHDNWYLQLSFAPLIDHLGRPEILLDSRKMTVKDVTMPDGRVKDIVIPLDEKGRMLLDWPRTDYENTLSHVSFAYFSQLDELEMNMEDYNRRLSTSDILFFAQFEPSFSRIPIICSRVEELYDMTRMAKNLALENCSDEYFEMYLDYRNQSHAYLEEILNIDIEPKLNELVPLLTEEFPESAELIIEAAEEISELADYIGIEFYRWREINDEMREKLYDKFCIMGRTDTGTTDYGANPFHPKYVNVGTHGIVLDTILSESFIIPVSRMWLVAIMFVFVPLFFMLSSRLTQGLRAASGFIVITLFVIFTILLFRFTGIFIGPLGTVFAMLGAVIAREIISYASSEKEKHFIRAAFSTYVSGDVVKEIIADPSRLQLGGTKRFMTAIFTDVQGFSGISEKLDAEDLVSLLNRYLSAMSNVVLDEKGTIDKYEGDAIIAFFGAPIDLADHALRACVSAITMKRIEAELNKTIMENKNSPDPLLTRIGINTGYMVAGNMGTDNKMNYTIMGNAVNLAARLEGVNKQYGTWILASEATVRETADRLLARRLDRVRVVGVQEPVRIYELIEMAENATEAQRNTVRAFHEALEYFENRNWNAAIGGFREVLSINSADAPSKIFLDRCEKYSDKPPNDNWDGVYNLTQK